MKTKLYALIEVCLAFVCMHVGFRWFRRYTELGQLEVQAGVNLSPGVFMILTTALMILLVGRNRSAMRASGLIEALGLPKRDVLFSIRPAAICLLLLGLGGIVLWGFGFTSQSSKTSWPGAIANSVLNLFVAMVLIWLLRLNSNTKSPRGRLLDKFLLALFLLIAIAPTCWALLNHAEIAPKLWTVFWVLIGSGFGEELFFRGYVQGRLNSVFGRRWSLWGTHFGPGLFLAAALFGTVHVLNTADYFSGVYHFQWRHGLTTMTTLYFGFLREKTNSVLAPALVHGFGNLGVRLPSMFV
ncbi:MAG: CPBP family intramembrane metalloprotease [Planctomycetes bacterium]|nr:CPBP family intramembrane metalloprotease [Planctomycetota bacterium]